jgi:hypothetical protein
MQALDSKTDFFRWSSFDQDDGNPRFFRSFGACAGLLHTFIHKLCGQQVAG